MIIKLNNNVYLTEYFMVMFQDFSESWLSIFKNKTYFCCLALIHKKLNYNL
jgi:hypothetical protein